MKIMNNGERRIITTFEELMKSVRRQWSLDILESVQSAGREEELMECFNEAFSDYEDSLSEVEDYLTYGMCHISSLGRTREL